MAKLTPENHKSDIQPVVFRPLDPADVARIDTLAAQAGMSRSGNLADLMHKFTSSISDEEYQGMQKRAEAERTDRDATFQRVMAKVVDNLLHNPDSPLQSHRSEEGSLNLHSASSEDEIDPFDLWHEI